MSKRIILTGETGSGKTYKAIKKFNNNKRFIYMAPCRQLVYESFIEYSSEIDSIKTGEVSFYGTISGNMYSVYESVRVNDILSYDSVIIDEAHFVYDEERGNHLLKIIDEAKRLEKDIWLVTATDVLDRRNFRDFSDISLTSNFKTPEKIEISENKFYENIKNGLKTVIFCRSISETFAKAESLKEIGIKAEAINSTILPAERLKIQYDFKRSDLQVVCSTNVLAQGLNFPAENVYITCDMWNTDELLIQKLGRLGRPFLSNSDKVYYHTEELIPKKLKKKKFKKFEKEEVFNYFPFVRNGVFEDDKNFIKIEDGFIKDSSFLSHQICNLNEYYSYDYNCYNRVKYSKGFIYFIKKHIAPLSYEIEERIDKIIYWLKKNEEEIYNLITKLKYEKEQKA